MNRYLRLLICLPLLATTACAADAIAGPELAPEPEADAVVQAVAEPAAVEVAAPAIVIQTRLCCACSLRPQATKPMYIVDGVVVLTLADVDNDDIDSVEVLRGETAASLYGTRAERGVILITTRTGARLRS